MSQLQLEQEKLNKVLSDLSQGNGRNPGDVSFEERLALMTALNAKLASNETLNSAQQIVESIPVVQGEDEDELTRKKLRAVNQMVDELQNNFWKENFISSVVEYAETQDEIEAEILEAMKTFRELEERVVVVSALVRFFAFLTHFRSSHWLRVNMCMIEINERLLNCKGLNKR